MDNLEGSPSWLPFQPVCVATLMSDLLTGGNHVSEEGRDDVRDGFVEDLDTVSLST